MKTRRVGSFTCGVMCILFGLLFLLHGFLKTISYAIIIKIWPIILISMGIEYLIYNFHNESDEKNRLIYDKGAIMIFIILTFFSVCMSYLELLMSYGCLHFTY